MAQGYMDGYRTDDIKQFIEHTVDQRMTDALNRITEKVEEAKSMHAEKRAAEGQDVRMRCVALIMQEGKTFFNDGDPVQRADVLAQYVLTGKKPGEA